MEKSKKNIITNIIKWLIILVALVVVYIWKKEEINDAFREMRGFPLWVPLSCFLATVLHFVTEGFIIHQMTVYEKRQMTWLEAFKCGLYCAFFKMISLGSLSGIAEVYYISKHDIDTGRATGITLVQYAYQKLGITILGVLGFIALYAANVSTVREYARFGILGTIVALAIVIILLLVSASKKIADILVWIAGKIRIPEKVRGKIHTFNDAGIYFWQHKILCVKVTLLKTLKMTLWYSVAGITVYASRLSDGSPKSLVTYFLIPLLLMAVANMIGTVMVAPAGAGTIEFVVSLLFAPIYGTTAATVAILYRFYSMVVPFVLGAVVFAMDKKDKQVDSL